jgi:acetyl-CoA carboxylase carboxyltransferase component
MLTTLRRLRRDIVSPSAGQRAGVYPSGRPMSEIPVENLRMRHDYQAMLAKLVRDKELAHGMGGPDAIERHHQRGKLTCRERLDCLLDPESFVELGVLAKSRVQVPGRAERVAMAGGVVVGLGTIDQRPVLVIADDATVVSGARGAAGRAKASWMYRLAQDYNIPLISLMEASASRVQDQIGSKLWAGLSYDPHTTGFGDYLDLSGRVPLVAAVMGAAVGGPAFNACMSDFVTMMRGTSFMAVSGPPVVLGATGEESSGEELGGADVHARDTGQIDHVGQIEQESLDAIRRFLSYLPTHAGELPPRQAPTDAPQRRCEALYDIVPANQRRAYDMHRVITTVVDAGEYFELKPDYGRGIITCLARLHGYPVGIVANQPTYRAGVMDDQASYKAIHFMDVCDAFHLPLVFLVATCPASSLAKSGSVRACSSGWRARSAPIASRRSPSSRWSSARRMAWPIGLSEARPCDQKNKDRRVGADQARR